MGAGQKPWEDVIIKDPRMQSKKAMTLINWQNRGIHGDSAESVDIEIEGLSLDVYAHICAATAGGGDINSLYKKYGIRDQDHFNIINAAYQSAMSTDATGMLETHYSYFYMKHSPRHGANVNQAVADAMAASTADLQAKEKRDTEVNIKLKEMKWYDLGLLKFSVLFFTLFFVGIWDGFREAVLSISPYWYLGLFIVVSIPLLKKMYF